MANLSAICSIVFTLSSVESSVYETRFPAIFKYEGRGFELLVILKQSCACRCVNCEVCLSRLKLSIGRTTLWILRSPLRILSMMDTVALTELLGRPVRDPAGGVGGRVREVAIAPQDDRDRVALVIVKTRQGDR